MADQDKSLFNRRELARSAMIGGASMLLGSSSLGAQNAPPDSGRGDLPDARKMGAAGDGKTDDTLALQRAFDAAGAMSGGVFLPPGVYLVKELHVRPGTAIIGVPAWNCAWRSSFADAHPASKTSSSL